jgi:hypothetical protein
LVDSETSLQFAAGPNARLVVAVVIPVAVYQFVLLTPPKVIMSRAVRLPRVTPDAPFVT